MSPRDRARNFAKKILDATYRFENDDALLDWAIDVVLDIQREARREALEEAAKECDDEVRRGKADSRRSATNPVAAFQSGAAKCAWRIRALIDKPAWAKDPLCPTGECVGECDPEAHGLFSMRAKEEKG